MTSRYAEGPGVAHLTFCLILWLVSQPRVRCKSYKSVMSLPVFLMASTLAVVPTVGGAYVGRGTLERCEPVVRSPVGANLALGRIPWP